jgi:hypothetical protein
MRIVTIQKIKPIIMEAKTQAVLIQIFQRCLGLVYTVGNGSSGYQRHEFGRHKIEADQWYGINMEKRRKKRGKRESHWVGWAYPIPANCGVKQGSRTFTLLLPKDTTTDFRQTAVRQ